MLGFFQGCKGTPLSLRAKVTRTTKGRFFRVYFYKSSKGLLTLPMTLLETFVYSRVVPILLWPNSFWIIRTSVPFSNKWVAKLCLKVCNVTCFLIPACWEKCLRPLGQYRKRHNPPSYFFPTATQYDRYSLYLSELKQKLASAPQ